MHQCFHELLSKNGYYKSYIREHLQVESLLLNLIRKLKKTEENLILARLSSLPGSSATTGKTRRVFSPLRGKQAAF